MAVEQTVKRLIRWLLTKQYIKPEQSEWCHYMLIQYIMSILSLFLLLPVSAVIVGVWGAVFYTATFRILRQRTGGYHARTPHGCLLVALVLQVLFSLLAAATKDIYVSTTVILLSEVAIFLLGPANHPELHLSAKELKAVKPRMYVRQAIVFLVYVVALLMHQGMIASCIAMATFAVAVLLAIAHVDDGEIHRFKKEQANPKEVIRNHE